MLRDYLQSRVDGFADDTTAKVNFDQILGGFHDSPLPQGKRAHLAPDCGAPEIIARILGHFRERWALEPARSEIFVRELKETLKRLRFLEEAFQIAFDARAKHLLFYFMHWTKADCNFLKMWETFRNEQRLWIPAWGDTFVIRCELTLESSIEDIHLEGVEQRWISDFLLRDEFVATLCDTLNCAESSSEHENGQDERSICHVHPEQVKSIIRGLKVSQIRHTGPAPLEIAVQGWTSFDGVVLVVNNYPNANMHLPSASVHQARLLAIRGHVLQLLVHECAHTVLRLFLRDMDTSSPFCKINRDADAGSMQALRDTARIMDVPSADASHEPIRKNFELGVQIEKRVFGISIDYQKALADINAFGLIKDLVALAVSFASGTGGALPLFSVKQIEVEAANCRDYTVYYSFAMRYPMKKHPRRYK